VRHSPRYYFATELISIRDRSEFVQLLKQRPYDRTTAFVQDTGGVPARGVVRNVREWNNGARLEVETEGDAFLVISITPHKYWTITVDGIDVRPVVTNIGYQGVPVPRGARVVELRYHNPLIAAGGSVSVAALLVLLLIWRKSPLTADRAAGDDEHITRQGDAGDSPT
jgi:uncharacterized membrane protein YfhO